MGDVQPREHQLAALADVQACLAGHDRAQLVMACGTGKTLTARWLAQRLAARRTLVLLPSLALVAQTVTEWRRASGWDFEGLIVCSDPSTAGGAAERGSDGLDEVTGQVPFWARQRLLVVTGDAARPALVGALQRASTDRPVVVFATYHSLVAVTHGQAAAGSAGEFDLVVCDEAHRLAGDSGATFRLCLDSQQLRARKRLFMTATPVVIGRGGAPSATADYVDDGWRDPLTMGDEATFGPLAHRLSFAAAIEAGLLCDYRVLVVTRRLRADGHVDAQTAALAAVLDAVDSHGATRVLSFHGRVRKARAFAAELNRMGELSDGRRVWAAAVDASMSAGERGKVLARLTAPVPGRVAVVTNARCLGEGVDVPAVDAVMFADPKTSETDVAQAVGRVLRRSPGKTVGLVLLPVDLPAGADDDSALASGAYAKVWAVLRALRSHDERIGVAVDEVLRRKARQGSGSGSAHGVEGLVRWLGDGVVDPDLLETRLVTELGGPWERLYAALAAHVAAGGSAQVAAGCVIGGEPLGRWVAQQRTMERRAVLPAGRRARLQALPGWSWSIADGAFTASVAVLAGAYARGLDAAGIAAADLRDASGRAGPLGVWCAAQRRAMRRGQLPAHQVRLLGAVVGWCWQVLPDVDVTGVDALAEYVGWRKDANPDRDYIEDDFALGGWLAAVRRRSVVGRLSQDLRDELVGVTPARESPGALRWEVHDTSWRLHYAALVQHAAATGSAMVIGGTRVALPDCELEVGQWVHVQRMRRRAGELDTDRAAALGALPGWTWDARKSEYGEPIELGTRGARHGTGTGYTRGCRCEPCTVARRTRESDRKARVDGGMPSALNLVDAGQARANLRVLAAQGCGCKQMARAADVNVKTVNETLSGEIRRLHPDRAYRMEQLTFAVVAEYEADGRWGGLVPPGPVWVHIDALLAAGWPKAWLARELGLTSLQIRRDRRVSERTAGAVEALHSHLAGMVAPPRRHRQPMLTLAELEAAAQQAA